MFTCSFQHNRFTSFQCEIHNIQHNSFVLVMIFDSPTPHNFFFSHFICISRHVISFRFLPSFQHSRAIYPEIYFCTNTTATFWWSPIRESATKCFEVEDLSSYLCHITSVWNYLVTCKQTKKVASNFLFFWQDCQKHTNTANHVCQTFFVDAGSGHNFASFPIRFIL